MCLLDPEAGKGQTLNLSYPVSPQEVLNSDGGVVVKEKTSPMAEIYQSFIFPYEESHPYALHLKTHASNELFTSPPDSSVNLGSTHLTLQASG